jgi:transmembrane sensor
MKEMNSKEKIFDREWEELAVSFSDGEVDVDKAWNKLEGRISGSEFHEKENNRPVRRLTGAFIRIAAVALILIGLGFTAVYLKNNGIFSKDIIAVTGNDQKNLLVELPDGSKIFLNRNTQLSYRSDFGKSGRNVKLTGEAFFEISHDASKPFIIDAGKAFVRVVGTTFNVISSNSGSGVEVYVTTGKVILSDKSESRSMDLEPGYIGNMDLKSSGKIMNENPNYLAWKTGKLVYTGQKLDVVIKDLKRVYNMDIVADDPSILENPWSSPIENGTQETIILIICRSFNLSFTKEGDVYHLVKK